MAGRDGKTIRVSPQLAELLKEVGEEDAMIWMRSGKNLAEKHISQDRRLIEIGKREVEFKKERDEFIMQKNDILNQLNEIQIVKELNIKVDKLEREVEHLRELNKLR